MALKKMQTCSESCTDADVARGRRLLHIDTEYLHGVAMLFEDAGKVVGFNLCITSEVAARLHIRLDGTMAMYVQPIGPPGRPVRGHARGARLGPGERTLFRGFRDHGAEGTDALGFQLWATRDAAQNIRCPS